MFKTNFSGHKKFRGNAPRGYGLATVVASVEFFHVRILCNLLTAVLWSVCKGASDWLFGRGTRES